MTPEEKDAARLTLRSACQSLGRGGYTHMAKALGISPRGLRYKLTGKGRITDGDLIAAKHISDEYSRKGGLDYE